MGAQQPAPMPAPDIFSCAASLKWVPCCRQAGPPPGRRPGLAAPCAQGAGSHGGGHCGASAGGSGRGGQVGKGRRRAGRGGGGGGVLACTQESQAGWPAADWPHCAQLMERKGRTGSLLACLQRPGEVSSVLPCGLGASTAAVPSCPACSGQLDSYLQCDWSDACIQTSHCTVKLQCIAAHDTHIHVSLSNAAGGLASSS